MPPHPGDAGKAPVIHADDLETDGIHVGTQHHPVAGALFMADEIAHGVGLHRIHQRGGQLPQHLSDAGMLAAGGPGGGNQPGMEVQKIKHRLHLLPQ